MVTALAGGPRRWNAARVEAASVIAGQGLRKTRGLGDRLGDRVLYGLTALAALIGVATVAAIIWRVAAGAWPAIKVFHADFLWTNQWNPVTSQFGARDLLIGTIVTSFGAVLLATPVSIAIGLFLSELASPSVRGPVGTLVEMLAAVPSVVVGLWGIYGSRRSPRSTCSRSSPAFSAGSRSSRTVKTRSSRPCSRRSSCSPS